MRGFLSGRPPSHPLSVSVASLSVATASLSAPVHTEVCLLGLFGSQLSHDGSVCHHGVGLRPVPAGSRQLSVNFSAFHISVAGHWHHLEVCSLLLPLPLSCCSFSFGSDDLVHLFRGNTFLGAFSLRLRHFS